ncbi:MAG: winged helix-turn-helix domain-containing protein [Promethearchaeota archaeon]|jgi:DNA-binding transcriptional ArsR family regulator
MTPGRIKAKNNSLEITSKSKNGSLYAITDSDIKAKNQKSNQEKLLQGMTLKIYWYILTHRYAGVREIQKSLKLSSPGTVSYQINKLLKAGIVSKKEEDNRYYVKKKVKKGALGFYFHLGPFMIPRFSLYLVINVMGFVGYLIFASIYGDMFITNVGSIFFLFFLIFSTSENIIESKKLWERKPT